MDLRLDHQSNCSSFEFYLFNDISKDVKLILHFFIYIKMSIKNLYNLLETEYGSR